MLSNGKTLVGSFNVTFTSVINDCVNAEPDVYRRLNNSPAGAIEPKNGTPDCVITVVGY